MWKDTDIPLTYLITFRSYGSWLHGDERGSIDREHRRYGGPYAELNEKRRRYNFETLKSEPVVLSGTQRASVEHAIRDTCTRRKWYLHACNVTTNHAHSVVAIGTKKPEVALNALKTKCDETDERRWLLVLYAQSVG